MSRFLNEDQLMIQKMAREFAQTEVRPQAMEIDKSNRIPRKLYERIGELGFLGVLLPEANGGSEAGLTTAAVIIEELAKESPALALSTYVRMAMPTYLLEAPTTMLADKYLPGLISGKTVVSGAFTAPTGSTNFAEWPVFGKRDGDDWVLNGTKLYVTNTNAADLILALGFTEDYDVGCFVVEKGTPGVEDSHVERKMGMNGNCSGTYVFSNCRVPGDHFFVKQLGGPSMIGYGNALCAATALGIMESAWERTVEFTKVRTRTNEPLASKQVVAHRLARMWGQIESCRSLLYDTVQMADEGKPEAKMYINTCKYMLGETSIEVTKQCVWLHGGMGYCEDPGIARFARDAYGTTVADCTPDQHVETVAALLGLPGAEMVC